jgi:hypothetical protein
LRELEERLGVVEGAVEIEELVDLALEARLFLRELAGPLVVIPKLGLGGEVAELLDATLFGS